MKIDRIEAFIVGNPWKNWILVKVSTDQGHIGWGRRPPGSPLCRPFPRSARSRGCSSAATRGSATQLARCPQGALSH